MAIGSLSLNPHGVDVRYPILKLQDQNIEREHASIGLVPTLLLRSPPQTPTPACTRFKSARNASHCLCAHVERDQRGSHLRELLRELLRAILNVENLGYLPLNLIWVLASTLALLYSVSR